MNSRGRLLSSIPVIAAIQAMNLQAAGDIGGLIYEVMDWDDPVAVHRRWSATVEAERERRASIERGAR